MKTTLVYVHLPHDPEHIDLAARFLSTYHANPPLYPHETLVVCNGAAPTASTQILFASLNPSYLVHDDSGWDIGAYQKAAREWPCDLMVFFGGKTHFTRAGWLGRMVMAFQKHGDHLYGATANCGDQRVNVQPHIRTTGFWMSPALFNKYPIRVIDHTKRYEFEHGKTCLTTWIKQQGKKALMVTWDGEYVWPHWDSIHNGFHRGDQSGLLVRDRLTEPPYYPYK